MRGEVLIHTDHLNRNYWPRTPLAPSKMVMQSREPSCIGWPLSGVGVCSWLSMKEENAAWPPHTWVVNNLVIPCGQVDLEARQMELRLRDDQEMLLTERRIVGRKTFGALAFTRKLA